MKYADTNISEFRYERKYLIKQLSKYDVENIIKFHPAMFSEIFHQRFVNNLYFDSYQLNNYYENIEGVKNRIKVRIRWYGKLFGYIEKPYLEVKIKKGELGQKLSYSLTPFTLSKNTKIVEILESFVKFNDFYLIEFNSLIPTLLNRYSRKYFQSCSNNYRITVDNDLSYYHINNENNNFLNHYYDSNSVILELKYGQDFDREASYISSIFPFRISKISKYVNGVQNIFQSII